MNVHYRATLGVEQENPRTMKRYKEVGTCDGTSLEETLYTYEKFLCEKKRTKMLWKDTRWQFKNCLGETP